MGPVARVVDADVDELPADVAVAALPPAVCDAMPKLAELREILGVDVRELTRVRPS